MTRSYGASFASPPKARCLLALAGKTDIFRAKKILDGHMCILGDVPPAPLTLGTVDDVKA